MPEPAKDKDRGGKWLIEHHGDAILRLGGVTDLVKWQAAPIDLVLPTKLPDGLLFAWRAGRDRPERSIREETVLNAGVELAVSSPDLEHFGAELRAIPRPPEPWDPADEPDPES